MMKKLLILFVAGGLASVGCGSGERPLDPEKIELQTEVKVEAEEEGLTQAVAVDSVYGDPGLFDFTIPDAVEIGGTFRISFRNLGEEPLQIRYELRFFDADTFLIDNFIPFGQPLRLEPGQVREIKGEFLIRAGPIEELEFPALMQVVVRVQTAP